MALLDELERLVNPTRDLGGGPSGDPSAIAQLIMSGGRASLEGAPLFGGGVSPGGDLGPGVLFGASGRDLGPNGERIPQPLNADGSLPIRRAEPSPESRAAALPNNLKSVLDAADTIASNLTRGTVPERKTLLANPFGPGSYDPANENERQAVLAQGQRQKDFDRTRNVLSSDFLAKLPKDSQGEVVSQLLSGLGLTQTEEQKAFNLAKGRAEGEKAAGKGVKTALDPALLRSVGTPEFDEKFATAVAAGTITDPQQQLALERLHQGKLERSKVPDVDRRGLSDLRGSHQLLGELDTAYSKTPAAKSGKLSDSLKLALSTNSKIATLAEAELIQGSKLEPSEREFAAKYNSFLLGLRRLSGDPRFSDTDAVRALTALGNPSVGRDLYREQLKALRDDIATRYDTAREDLKGVGKNVEGLPGIKGDTKGAAPKGLPQGAQPTGRTSGGKPVFKLPDGRLWVE